MAGRPEVKANDSLPSLRLRPIESGTFDTVREMLTDQAFIGIVFVFGA
jgi:hypothetical protein